MRIGDQAIHQVNQEIDRTVILEVFNLGNVLELVNDHLKDGALAREQLVREWHQPILHITP